MRIKLLLLLAVSTTCFSLTPPEQLHEEDLQNTNPIIDGITASVGTKYGYVKPASMPLNEIKNMLVTAGGSLNAGVIDKVLTTLQCADAGNVEHKQILTVIDYSLPSNAKRLWVFDLKEKKLLFNTYVSHGIKSGALESTYFSNINNSKSSSIGVYKTNETYYGRDGLSLRLDGLERGFNDNASSRYVVMHGGWYVEENFIKKYGRAGRSWGCPALPLDLTAPIINTIKDKSLFVVYYPNDSWFAKSKFLNCKKLSPIQHVLTDEAKAILVENEPRVSILFADINKNNRHDEYEPIVAMAADKYERLLHTKAPVERMLRRQIDHMEYIALSDAEFKSVAPGNAICFIKPEIKMVRGYYETQMKIVPLGNIKAVNPSTATSDSLKNYTLVLDTNSLISLRSTNMFIRWVGL